MNGFVYVSAWDSDTITVLSMDADTGRLERIEVIEVPGRPAPMAIDAGQKYLFVGRRGAKAISSFRRDASTGALSHVNAIEVESDPCFLDTDRSGRFLFSAYYLAGCVAVHRIGDDGTLEAPPIEWRRTGKGAHCMRSDPSNRFAFVPHIAVPDAPNAIFQFRFDAATGRLEPNSPDRVVTGRPDGPRHICFHPSRDLVYSSNEQGCGVTAYRLDASAGTLAPVQTVSTLPGDFAGESKCSQIQMTPSGRFLYAPNRGHDTIAVFGVDAATGLLAALGHTETDAVPRAISLDASGRYLLAAGLDTGRLIAYQIDQETGGLESIEAHPVGRQPMWILATARSDT